MKIEPTLRVAIIGCGVIAASHIEGFRRIPGVEVVELCDVVGAKAAALAQRYGITHTSDSCEQTLARTDIDCVAICTDHASHAPIAIAALQSGKHVLCEKPLAESIDAVNAMVAAAAQRRDLIAAGVLQHRFDAVHRALRHAIAEGALGDLLQIQGRLLCYRSPQYYLDTPWRGKWRTEGGSLLMNQAIHFVDVLDWMGGGLHTVSATFANQTHTETIETEDSAAFIGYFGTGAMAVFNATSSSNVEWEPTMSVLGSKALVELRQGKVQRLECRDPHGKAQLEDLLSEGSDPAKLSAAKDYYGPSHTSQIADFVRAVRTNTAPVVSFADAARSVHLVQAIYQSARNQTWITVRQ